MAWSGLQQFHFVPPHEAGPKVREAALKAIELDETSAEAYYALAMCRTWTDWDWEGAETAYQRAIELNPNYADVRAYYAHFLMIMKREGESLAQIERALELDPLNPLLQGLYGVVLADNGRDDEAIEQFRNVLRTNPNQPFALGNMVSSLIVKGRYEEAVEVDREWASAMQVPGLEEALAKGYAEAGFQGAMSRAAEVYPNAWFYVMAGKKQEALNCLERDFEEHSPGMPYLGVNADWSSLRDEPRYQDLLRRMNFPEDVIAKILSEAQ